MLSRFYRKAWIRARLSKHFQSWVLSSKYRFLWTFIGIAFYLTHRTGGCTLTKFPRTWFLIAQFWSLNSSFVLKLVQCQPQLNPEIPPIVVQGVRFNYTQPIPKGFCHFSLFKGHPRPRNPQERRYFRYPKNNLPTYIISNPCNRDFP